MILSRTRTAMAALAAIVAAEEVRADPEQRSSAWALSGSLMLLTDYVDRGVSQSDGHSAIQGDLVWQHSSGGYVSMWGSSVDFDDGGEAEVELNYIVGFEREVGAALFDANVAYIQYPGAAAQLRYGLVEFSAAVERSVGWIDLGAHAVFTPRNAGDAGKALYVALGAGCVIAETISVGVHTGRQWHEREDIAGPSYHDWGLALEWSRGRFGAALMYSDMGDRGSCTDQCDARVTAGVNVSF